MKTFFPYEKNSCIDLIFALATNFTLKAMTVVELSLSRFFKENIVAYIVLLVVILHLVRIKKIEKKKEQKQRKK